MLRIYTDGSCTNNGRKGARAGYAVVYPDYPSKTWGDTLGEATNQTAELTAIYEGLREGKTVAGDPGHTQAKIYTDSEYSINCLTKWVSGWKKKGWKTSEGKPVVHREIIEKILEELGAYASYVFTHVKAHTGGSDEHSKWNQVADDVARKAAEDGKRVTLEDLNVKVTRDIESTEYVLPGIPLALMGAPISERDLLKALKENLGSLDESALNSALLSALKKTLQNRSYDLEKSKIFKMNHYRLTEESKITIQKLEDE